MTACSAYRSTSPQKKSHAPLPRFSSKIHFFCHKAHIILAYPPTPVYNHHRNHPRGISSVGRAVASHATGQGFESPMLHLIPETESENNLVRFLFCIDFQHLRPLRHCTLASDATALPGAKQHQKVKKPKHA